MLVKKYLKYNAVLNDEFFSKLFSQIPLHFQMRMLLVLNKMLQALNFPTTFGRLNSNVRKYPPIKAITPQTNNFSLIFLLKLFLRELLQISVVIFVIMLQLLYVENTKQRFYYCKCSKATTKECYTGKIKYIIL